MLNVAGKPNFQGAWLGTGKVKAVEPDCFSVSTEFGEIAAQRADGCLLAPESGDQILLVWVDEETAFILNVLKRGRPDSPAVLSHPGDAHLKIGGDLKLSAANLAVGDVEKVSIQTDLFNLSCLKGGLRFGQFNVQGRLATATIDSLRCVAKHLETTAERVMERFKRSYRRVEDFEDARIGRMHLWIKGLFAVDSESAEIKSSDKVRVEADKILLG